MKKNTEKNRDKLAEESVDQMDLKTLMGVVKEQLETYYTMLSPKDFNREWKEVFGEE